MTKADFDEIYAAPDPRPYYETLGRYDYEIPRHSAAVFDQIARGVSGRSRPRIVDLCCSYGVNAAVLRHDVDFDDIVEHYTSAAFRRLGSEQMVAVDRSFFGARRLSDAVHVIGVDSSPSAIEYAVDAGLVDDGFAEDLEAHEPSEQLRRALGESDLVTVSGGIGYITETTIGKVLDAMPTPRLAALSLRWIDFGPIVDAGAARGLVTERLDEATFPQRDFADSSEQDHVERELDALGIDPSGREAEGRHHTDLYLLRVREEVDATPLAELVDPSGAVSTPPSRGSRVETSVFESGTELP